MDVVILGGGTVGQSIAAMLGPNGHNVCLVDESADVLERLEETLDIQTVRGNGCDAATLSTTMLAWPTTGPGAADDWTTVAMGGPTAWDSTT
ncbi:MAG: NAD-binding protein, partial [Planctomycetota bacterium]